jgi:hypothetical protein
MPQSIRLLALGRGAALISLAVVMLTGASHAQEAQMVPVTVDGERVRLEMRIYTPAGPVPSPTLVFNHGSLSHSRANFAAFQTAGGRGAFHELPPEFGGHFIWRRPDRWGPLVEGYLKRLGLPSDVN